MFQMEQNHIFTYESKFCKLPLISQTVVNTFANEAANKKKKKMVKQVQSEQVPQPLLKDWFEKLKVEDRVKCLSTIDLQITSQILNMCKGLLRKWNMKPEKERNKFPWYCGGMFVLVDRPSRGT